MSSISRVIRLGGWRNFEMEDYCMALTFVRRWSVFIVIWRNTNRRTGRIGLLHQCHRLCQYTAKASFHKHPASNWNRWHVPGANWWSNIWQQDNFHYWRINDYDPVGMQSLHVPFILQINVGCERPVRFPVLITYKYSAGLGLQRQVKFLMGYVALGWLVTEIFFFGIWCRPFLNYFRVFEDNDRKLPNHQDQFLTLIWLTLSWQKHNVKPLNTI